MATPAATSEELSTVAVTRQLPPLSVCVCVAFAPPFFVAPLLLAQCFLFAPFLSAIFHNELCLFSFPFSFFIYILFNSAGELFSSAELCRLFQCGKWFIIWAQGCHTAAQLNLIQLGILANLNYTYQVSTQTI